MRRWGLDESLLPSGTNVLFKPPSPVKEYWPYILSAALIIAAQSAIILAFWAQKRKRLSAEHALRQVNEHLDIAATTANVGLWSWRPAGDHVWLTSHCRRMLGLAEQGYTPLETFLSALAGPKRDGARRAMIWSLRTNGTFRGEYRTADKTGRETWISAVGNCIRHGRELVIAGTLLDVSERKMAQLDAEQQRRQITHLTRVAVLGELSGALAHELNQPLTAILSNAQTAQRLMNRETPTVGSNLGELREIVADIIEDNHRAGAVISKLRALIRREETQYAALDLNQMVDDVLHLVHSDLIERQIQVRTEFGDNLPPARGDPVQIQQVLINLVRNACDAMSAPATQPRNLVLMTDRSDNDGLAVTVADSGMGISNDMQERLFDPFVTTKPQGLGLGLTICQSILRAHGGKIWCKSNDGGGAVFGFSLPVFEGGVA
jgi:PAS domain S-box-containing protein